jgi:hypothetical protein
MQVGSNTSRTIKFVDFVGSRENSHQEVWSLLGSHMQVGHICELVWIYLARAISLLILLVPEKTLIKKTVWSILVALMEGMGWNFPYLFLTPLRSLMPSFIWIQVEAGDLEIFLGSFK